MRGAFGQVYQLARTRYPGLEVVGSNYPVPAWKLPIINALKGLQMGALAVCIFGDHIFRHLGMAPPEWYIRSVASNRFGAAMGVWFFGNFAITNLQNTGAFELYLDGQLVFSKLAEGRMPTAPEILGPLEAYFAGGPGAGVGPGLGAGAAPGAALGLGRL